MTTMTQEETALSNLDRYIVQECIKKMQATQHQLTQILDKLDDLEGRIEELEESRELSF